jgi:hypothetical protein
MQKFFGPLSGYRVVVYAPKRVSRKAPSRRLTESVLMRLAMMPRPTLKFENGSQGSRAVSRRPLISLYSLRACR